MSYRQYIGARYVPKFFENNGSSEWASGVQYEPLTIVTYLGNSYTSKKTVPSSVGAPNINPEYWVSTGIYNAQVEEYRQEVEDVKADVEDIQGDIETIEGNIVQIQSDIEKITDRKFILIGDSYALSNHGDWTQKLKDLLTGFTVWRLQQSGASFINSGYLTLLQGWVANHASDANSITDIIVAGGANDATSSLNDLATAMPAFTSYVNANLPNAKIHVGFIGWINPNSSVFANRTPSYQRQVVNYYCNKALNGMDYLNGVTMVLHDMTLIDTDGIHPNLAGGDAIASAIYQSLMNGYTTISRYDNIAGFTVVNGTLSGTFYQTISGELILLRHTDLRFEFTTAPTITNSWTTIATGFVLPYSCSLAAFSVWANVRDTADNLYKQKHLLMRVSNGELQVKLDESQTASAWLSITASQIRMYANTYTFDGILATA